MPKILSLLRQIASSYSQKSRLARGTLFLQKLKPKARDKILDLGSGTGFHFRQFVKPGNNVFISDVNSELLSIGKSQFGYNTILVDANIPLPFKDKQFDIVFCNSLIEHVTGDKKRILYLSNSEFKNYAYIFQKQLAKEIRRVTKSYFVQTPYKFFPLESHTWLPFFFILLPRRMQISTIIFLNRYWVKKTYPDWSLLTVKQMRELFPDAEIIFEKSFGCIKSIIAVRK